MKKRVTVVVVEPSRIACQLMSNVLKHSSHRFNVVGCASETASAVSLLRQEQPQVALVSANLREGPEAGFEVLRAVHGMGQQSFGIALLDHARPDMIVEAFRAGVHGVFCREEPLEGLFNCIQSVAQGQIWVDNKELSYLLDVLAHSAKPRSVGIKLDKLVTRSEEAVIRLVNDGLTNREIARYLNLSEHTVRNYLFRVFEKLGVSSRVELVLYCLNERKPEQAKEAS